LKRVNLKLLLKPLLKNARSRTLNLSPYLILIKPVCAKILR
jgi:hypothetical protein